MIRKNAEENRRYVEFMYDRKNIRNCDGCPENIGCCGWQGNLPCGQQNCWVEVHCGSDDSGN